MSRVQLAVGSIFAFLGTCALASNSYLLGSGAIRWAHQDDIAEKIALAVGGGLVPWILALIPMLLALVVVDHGWATRWGQRGLIVLLWLLFFGYNFAMGASNLSKLREDTVAAADYSRDSLGIDRDMRATLRGQLAAIPAHRPPEVVEPLLEAQRNQKAWKATDGCVDVTRTASRAFCDAYKALESELAAGRAAEKLTADIAAADAAIKRAPATATASADPFVDRAHNWTGWDKEDIRILQSMATPVALEVAGAVCWKIAFLLFGWTLQRVGLAHGATGADLPPMQLQSPDAINRRPEASVFELTRARQLCEWFFRECAKPSPAGSLLEREWYDLYAEICRRHNDTPIPLEGFRRIAARNKGMVIADIESGSGMEKHYLGYLPFVPAAQPETA